MNTAYTEVFDKQKTACLAGIDLSRKGSVDAPIQDLVQYINDLNNYFTTSSCSGRIMVVENNDNEGIKKKGCRWIFSSHDKIAFEDLKCNLGDINSTAVFKFEPFVLHVQCRSLSDAQHMMSCGVSSGYRNSGIGISGKGKTIVAIRSTHSLEVPISEDGKLLVGDEYIAYLVKVANKKMEDNFSQIKRLFSTLKSYIEGCTLKQQDSEKHKEVPRKHKLSTVDKTRNLGSRSVKPERNPPTSYTEHLCDLFGEDNVT